MVHNKTHQMKGQLTSGQMSFPQGIIHPDILYIAVHTMVIAPFYPVAMVCPCTVPLAGALLTWPLKWISHGNPDTLLGQIKDTAPPGGSSRATQLKSTLLGIVHTPFLPCACGCCYCMYDMSIASAITIYALHTHVCAFAFHTALPCLLCLLTFWVWRLCVGVHHQWWVKTTMAA